MFIKEAVLNATRTLFSPKQLSLQNGLLTQWLLLATLKNYIYSWMTDQQLFTIPDTVRDRAHRKKLILVLDMDQTLVYTRREHSPSHYNYNTTEFEGSHMYVEPRPFVRQFLKAVAEIFTIYVYTAGKKTYADTVLRIIDPDNLIEKKFYRDSCRRVDGKLIKDLSYLRKRLRVKQEMILVDDNCDSISHNYPLAVKIEPYTGDQKDTHLIMTFQQILKFYH